MWISLSTASAVDKEIMKKALEVLLFLRLSTASAVDKEIKQKNEKDET